MVVFAYLGAISVGAICTAGMVYYAKKLTREKGD